MQLARTHDPIDQDMVKSNVLIASFFVAIVRADAIGQFSLSPSFYGNTDLSAVSTSVPLVVPGISSRGRTADVGDAAVERTPITSTRGLAYCPVVLSMPTSAWTLGLIFEI